MNTVPRTRRSTRSPQYISTKDLFDNSSSKSSSTLLKTISPRTIPSEEKTSRDGSLRQNNQFKKRSNKPSTYHRLDERSEIRPLKPGRTPIWYHLNTKISPDLSNTQAS